MEPFNGDFIQRHARAASAYNDIHVIYVTGNKSLKKDFEEEIKKSEGLSEQIIYFKPNSSFLGKIIDNFRWQKLYRRAIKEYINENGRPDLVHVHVPLKAGIAALWVKKKYHIPLVVTEHWGIYNSIVPDNFKTRHRFFQNYSRRIISSASAFISVSKYLAEEVNRMVVKKNYHVIPNVVDTSHFIYKEKAITNPITIGFRFIHVSGMMPLKNAEGIIRAFKLFLKDNNAELIMAGDTDPSIRKYAAELGLLDKTVFFRGEIAYEQVAGEMQQSHCLVLFSNIENSPCVIAEGLCCGLPVIATAVGGIPELLNKNNGILIEPRNEEQLAAALKQMINTYPGYDLKKIAEDAQSKFSYDIVGKKIDQLYDSVLGQ